MITRDTNIINPGNKYGTIQSKFSKPLRFYCKNQCVVFTVMSTRSKRFVDIHFKDSFVLYVCYESNCESNLIGNSVHNLFLVSFYFQEYICKAHVSQISNGFPAIAFQPFGEKWTNVESPKWVISIFGLSPGTQTQGTGRTFQITFRLHRT